MTSREQFEAFLVGEYEWANDTLNAAQFHGDDVTGYYTGGDFIYDGQSCSEGLFWAWRGWQAASMALVEALEKAQTINAAAEKLVRCKGRYHSEQNYRALAALFGVNTPDLPPLDGESQPVTVKLPSGTGWASDPYNHGYNDGISECAKELRTAGINVEAE